MRSPGGIERSGAGGFTLIELLVVIAIIALLSTIVLGSLSSARERAIQARRVSDATAVAKALELYRFEYDTYPATLNAAGTTNQTSPCTNGQRSCLINLADELVPQYLSAIPVDEARGNGNSGYQYCRDERPTTAAMTADEYVIIVPVGASSYCTLRTPSVPTRSLGVSTRCFVTSTGALQYPYCN